MRKIEIFGVAVGSFVIGGLVVATLAVDPIQSAYTEGRNSVLNSPVTLQGPEQCAPTVPLSVLVDMVNVGLMDWHKLCIDLAAEERG